MKYSLVSVVIPTYNSAAYLKEAVDSALAQTYRAVEVVVVDDGSTDGTKKILEPYIKDKKIEYVYQPNKGLAGARNTGIRAARGAYVALLDADDIFLPEKIGSQVARMEENPACDISYTDLYHFEDGEPDELKKLRYTYYSGKDVLPNLLKKSFIAPSAVMIRASTFARFGYFDEEIRQYAEDYDYWLRVASRGGEICFVPAAGVKMRVRTHGNIQGMENQPKMKIAALRVLERLRDGMSPEERRKYSLDAAVRKSKIKAYLAYLLVGDARGAAAFARGAFRHGVRGRLIRAALLFLVGVLPGPFLKRCVEKMYFGRRRAIYGKI